MKCPVCNDVNLLLSERQGIEIDYCPTCRGVWLDRGELDKIIERTAPTAEQQYVPGDHHFRQPDRQHPSSSRHTPPQYQQQAAGHGHGHFHKKKKSLLSEIFDFD